VFLWLESDPEKIAAPARAALADTDNELYVSSASGWEIAIKYAIGKLMLPSKPLVYVPSRISRGGFGQLDISMEHVLATGALPPLHDDPFDRLLIAQAQVEGLTLVTADARIRSYPIHTLQS